MGATLVVHGYSLAGKYAQQQLSRLNAGGASAAFATHQDMRKDFQAIDMVQAEAARQVCTCVAIGLGA